MQSVKILHLPSSLGISTKKYQIIALMLSGFVIAFGGMQLSMTVVSQFTSNMSAGNGFIALAVIAMVGAKPIYAIIGAFLFSMIGAASNYLLPTRVIQ